MDLFMFLRYITNQNSKPLQQAAMDSLKLLSFAGIIKEAIRILFKNGKIMPSITLITLLIYCILYFSNTFSIKPLITTFVAKLTILFVSSPTNPSEYTNLIRGIIQDLRVLTELGSIFYIVTKTLSLFLTISIISASSQLYHSKKDLPFKELFSRILRSWKEPLVTLFYTHLLSLGNMGLVLSVMLALIAILNDRPIILYTSCFVLSVLGLVFYIYLSVIWTLGLVVSVIEENCSGLEAIGKAAKLVKGRKLQGFRLKVLILIIISLMQGIGLITIKRSGAFHLIMGFLEVNLEIFVLVAFTVFYYQCKKIHDEEEVEFHGSLEYSKLPNP